ncbi:MAG: SPASM domain-containing protein [Bradyrhizobium sp.]
MEFEFVRSQARKRIPNSAWLDDAAAQMAYPDPKGSVCAALAKKSVVIGADGVLYRCGLQVGEKPRGVGSISSSSVLGAESVWWDNFDPTKVSDCRRCSFLPVCWGGCAKRHLDHDSNSRAALSEYWRSSLPNRIINAAQFSLTAYRAFTEEEQFRGDGLA